MNNLLPECVLEFIRDSCPPGLLSKPHLPVPVSEPVHVLSYLENSPNIICSFVYYHSAPSLHVCSTQDTLLSFLCSLPPQITFFTYLLPVACKLYQNKVYVAFIPAASLAEFLFFIFTSFSSSFHNIYIFNYIVLLLSK